MKNVSLYFASRTRAVRTILFVTCTMSLHSYLFSRQCLASAQRRETRSTPVIHLYYLKRKCIQWNSLSNWHLHKYSRLFVFFSSSKVISSPYVIARWDTCDTAFSFWQFFLSLPLPLRESPLAEEWAQWWPLIVWCLSRHSRRLKSTSSMDKHWVSSDISQSLHFTGDANGTLCIFAMNSICHIETINCLSKIEFARSLNFSFLSFSLSLFLFYMRILFLSLFSSDHLFSCARYFVSLSRLSFVHSVSLSCLRLQCIVGRRRLLNIATSATRGEEVQEKEESASREWSIFSFAWWMLHPHYSIFPHSPLLSS